MGSSTSLFNERINTTVNRLQLGKYQKNLKLSANYYNINGKNSRITRQVVLSIKNLTFEDKGTYILYGYDLQDGWKSFYHETLLFCKFLFSFLYQ